MDARRGVRRLVVPFATARNDADALFRYNPFARGGLGAPLSQAAGSGLHVRSDLLRGVHPKPPPSQLRNKSQHALNYLELSNDLSA